MQCKTKTMGKNFCKIETKWCRFLKRNKGIKCCTWSGEKCPLSEIHRCPKRESTRTVRLKDYLEDIEFEDVMDAMLHFYPEEKKNRNGYLTVFNQLKSMDAIKTDWFIEVEIAHEDEKTFGETTIEACDWLHVNGISPSGREYGIGFVSWSEWLGMNISKKTLDTLDKKTIIGGVLYEMTWYGFNEEKVKNFHDDLESQFEEARQLS